MTISKLVLEKTKEVSSLLSKDQLASLDPRKLFTIAVSDEKNNYQGYRLLTDKVPSNYQAHKINGITSLLPIVTGG